SIFPVRCPIPTGPHGTKPIPSSSQAARTPFFSGPLSIKGRSCTSPVLVVEIDSIRPEAPERRLDHLPDVRGPAIEPPCLEVESELGRDDDCVTEGRERLADEVFVRVG